MDMPKSSKRFTGAFQKDKKRVFGYSYISQEDANKKAKDKWESKYNSPLPQPSSQGRVVETFHDLAVTFYQPTIINAPLNTYNGYWRDTYKRHIEKALGAKPFRELLKVDFDNLINVLDSYNKKMKAKIVCKAIIHQAKLNNIPLNVSAAAIEEINIGRKPEPAPLRINSKDVRDKVAMCERHMYLPLYILGTIGVRKGELIALKHKDIDREDPNNLAIHICRQRLKDGSLDLPKGGKTRRFEIDQEFLDMVDAYANQDSEWLITPGGKAPFSHSSFGREWKKLGFEKGIGPHQLRHFVATLLANSAGLLATQKVLGHRHATTTERYTHADSVSTTDAIRVSTQNWKSVVNHED